jgi:hypothetical protein
MTAGNTSIHPDEKFKAGKLGKQMTGLGLGIAAVFFGISIVVVLAGLGGDWRRFWHAYVIGWSFVTSIAIGCLWIIIIHHLTRSRWSTVVRRLCEIVTGAFPILFVAGLPFIIAVVSGYDGLYYWTTEAAHNDHHLHGKAGWLDPTLFAARFAIYFGLYIAMSRYFAGKSREQDETGDPNLSEKMRIASGPAIIVFSLTTVFFGFDILMSFAPKWYSTIYSVNFWGGAMIGAYAFVALLGMAIQRTGRLTHSVTTEHYHDLGKWIFAFVFFWAYTAFSQFMLIWYANIPEETVWYKYRMFSDWQWVSIAVGVGQWAFPFVFLLSRWTKRILPSLAAFAVWVLGFHWLDLYWNVMPNINWGAHATVDGNPAILVTSDLSTKVDHWTGPLTGNPADHAIGFSPVDVTTWLALIGVLIAGVGMSLKGNLIPVKDPQLPNSLGFENY